MIRPITLFLAALLTGCSSYSTVTVPAGEETVVSAPADTTVLETLPPAEIDGTRTEPVEVTVYEDTSQRETVDLSWLEVDRSDPDRQTITARVERGSSVVEKTFKLPEVGESTRLFSRGSGLEGTVFGAPTDRTEKAITSTIERPWYMRLGRNLRLLAAIVFGAFLSYVVVKLTPGL
ncbi:hypothetical protein [Salinibacter ruber]|uniref:hypothetical protein n=1 Tax=Salinibacter ruber TaxID=146919 RepID=UPI002074089A|nr:hypothetical protein [Salinibacter ruber]